ncbi:MAG: hypothetical protein COV46_02490 [Deltaproteobacteria bacterium CG11_big_fil_rev_8_21_14_0_20_49_13]|nr:MAG: hypothetical protein COV46_02490 [Deltaproteobacteria bacterium CG11_big_fil_rev_8_21_14_0_20_49_13]
MQSGYSKGEIVGRCCSSEVENDNLKRIETPVFCQQIADGAKCETRQISVDIAGAFQKVDVGSCVNVDIDKGGAGAELATRVKDKKVDKYYLFGQIAPASGRLFFYAGLRQARPIRMTICKASEKVKNCGEPSGFARGEPRGLGGRSESSSESFPPSK